MKLLYGILKKSLNIFILSLCLMTTVACNKDEFRTDTVYIFWKEGCSHCHMAMEFIDKNYPDVKVEKLNLADKPAIEKLRKAAVKFKIKGNKVFTPFFVVNNSVLMGWSNSTQEEFKKHMEIVVE